LLWEMLADFPANNNFSLEIFIGDPVSNIFLRILSCDACHVNIFVGY